MKSVMPVAKRRNNGQDTETGSGIRKEKKSPDSAHLSVEGMKMSLGTYSKWSRMLLDVSRFDHVGEICNRLSTW